MRNKLRLVGTTFRYIDMDLITFSDSYKVLVISGRDSFGFLDLRFLMQQVVRGSGINDMK